LVKYLERAQKEGNSMGLYVVVWELQDRVYKVVESNNSKILLGSIVDEMGPRRSTSNLEKRHASLLGLYIVIGKGINTSLLKYYKVCWSNYSGPVHVVRTTTMTG
jgi:hypothetical protein